MINTGEWRANDNKFNTTMAGQSRITPGVKDEL